MKCVQPPRTQDWIEELQRRVEDRPDLTALADFLQMAGNTTRIRILFLLQEAKELCVCDIADVLDITASGISQHLRKMKDRGVIASRREGQTIFYSLTPNAYSKPLRVYLKEPAK